MISHPCFLSLCFLHANDTLWIWCSIYNLKLWCYVQIDVYEICFLVLKNRLCWKLTFLWIRQHFTQSARYECISYYCSSSPIMYYKFLEGRKTILLIGTKVVFLLKTKKPPSHQHKTYCRFRNSSIPNRSRFRSRNMNTNLAFQWKQSSLFPLKDACNASFAVMSNNFVVKQTLCFSL